MTLKSPHSRIALVLQGGGALGAYQAGVFQAMAERGLEPEWVVGTSIGAVNAALIAGNAAEDRVPKLREFWRRVAQRDPVDMRLMPDLVRRANTWLATMEATMEGIPGFFKPRPLNPFAAGMPVEAELASFYDTSPLGETLAELTDLDRLNAPDAMRLTVNAVCVTSGELASFDSSRQRLGIEHVLASSALPPGFPPVRVDGRLYWDGGLYSNTPMEIVLDEEPRHNTLCFMVDLWRAEGPEPQTLEAVRTRHKDVLYASRSRRHIEEFRRMHDLRHALHALREQLPSKLRDSEQMQTLTAHACPTVMHIVHLPYGGHDWYMASKDINFSSGSIEWRWQQGYNDASRAAELSPWLTPQPSHVGVVVHELPPKETGENPTGTHAGNHTEGDRHHENAA